MQFTKALQHTIVWKTGNTILSFGINLILVRIFGAQGSGEFFYAIALLSFVTLVMSWSMETGITYYASANPDKVPAISLIVFPWLILQGVASWAVLQLIRVEMNLLYGWIFIVSNLIIIYFSALYYARRWFIAVNVISCLVNLLVLATLAGIYIFSAAPIETLQGEARYVEAEAVYFSGFLIQALIFVGWFFTRSKPRKLSPVFEPELVRKIFLYSTIAFTSNILFFLVTRIDYYFVKSYCDDVSLSNYVQVTKIGQVLILLPSMIAAVVFPYTAGTSDDNYLGKLQGICRGITLLFLPVCFVLILSGYWIFPWLFGEGFHQMYVAFLLYLPGFYCLSLVTLLAAYLAGKSMLGKNLIASLLALIVVIIGDILLIPAWGINAAAAVSSIAYFCCLSTLTVSG